MEFTVDIPDKYAEKLAAVEEVDPSVRDQIEVETLPHVLRLINEAHRQLDEQGQASLHETAVEDDQ